jgi:hypothetical protein
MKNLLFVSLLMFFIIFNPASAFSQEEKSDEWSLIGPRGFDFGKLFFSVSPRPLEGGFITDMTVGYRYAENTQGKVRFRSMSEDNIDTIDVDSIESSQNASRKENFEVLLFPFERLFQTGEAANLKAGIGLYYGNNSTKERGLFDMPDLEATGKPRVNSLTNDFITHSFGPVIEAGFSRPEGRFGAGASIGVVPVFFYHGKQDIQINNLGLSDSNTQTQIGYPYVYANISMTALRRLALDFLWDFSYLEHESIYFNNSPALYNFTQTTISNTLRLETSLMFQVRQSVFAKLGIGWMWQGIQYDNNETTWKRQLYFLFDAKTI